MVCFLQLSAEGDNFYHHTDFYANAHDRAVWVLGSVSVMGNGVDHYRHFQSYKWMLHAELGQIR